MYPKIVKRNCVICNVKTETLIHTKNTHCCKCIRNVCSLTHIPDNFNRHNSCNFINDPIVRDNRTMCIGHYKRLQMHCKICGEPRNLSDNLSYDDWYYCYEHKPPENEQAFYVNKYLENDLPNDCIKHILTFL